MMFTLGLGAPGPIIRKALHKYAGQLITLADGTRQIVDQGSAKTNGTMYSGAGKYGNGIDIHLPTEYYPNTNNDVSVILDFTISDSINATPFGVLKTTSFAIKTDATNVTISIGGVSIDLPHGKNVGDFCSVAFSYDALTATAECYLDGVYKGSLTGIAKQSYIQSVALFALNANVSITNYYQGIITTAIVALQTLTATEIASHYQNPEKTLYWDNGTLKSDSLDQATIDSLQAGNGFWYPLTENLSAGGYYRNHALPMPSNSLPQATPDIIQSAWVDNGDGSYTCNGNSGPGTRDLIWYGDVSADNPLVVELEIFNYVSGTLGCWDGGSNSFAGKNGVQRIILSGNVSGRYATVYSLSSFVGAIRNIKTYPLAGSGLTPLVNWDSTTTTNAQQLPYGNQQLLMPSDEFGLQSDVGVAGELYGDGIGKVVTSALLPNSDFCLDFVYDFTQQNSGINFNVIDNTTLDANNIFRLMHYSGQPTPVMHYLIGNRQQAAEIGVSAKVVTIEVITAGEFKIYSNGILVKSETGVTIGDLSGLGLRIFNTGWSAPLKKSIGTIQITKGTRTDDKRLSDIQALAAKHGVTI